MANALMSMAVMLGAVSVTGTGGSLQVPESHLTQINFVTPIGREFVNIRKRGRISNWKSDVNDSAHYSEDALLDPFIPDEKLRAAFATGIRASKINGDTLKALMNA